MTTVMDQARPWLIPSRTLAATIHAQLGAMPISSGTGSATAQPAISSRRRPTRWASAPAPRLVSAFASPKATMNDSTAALEVRPKSWRPMSGRVERSRPTIMPTNALTATSSENCARVLAQPEADRPGLMRSRPAAGRSGWRRRSPPAARVRAGCRAVSACTNCVLGVELQRWVVAALEADRRDRVGRQAAAADRPGVVRRVEHEVVGERQQPLGQRAVQRAGHLLDGVLAVGVEVGAAGVTDEQRVAGEHEPRLVARGCGR